MNMIGHHNEVRRGQRRMSRVNAAPKRRDLLARLGQNDARRQFAVLVAPSKKLRQNRSTPSDAKRQKEETPPALVKLQLHRL